MGVLPLTVTAVPEGYLALGVVKGPGFIKVPFFTLEFGLCWQDHAVSHDTL